jgi:hypothetical protein
MNYEHDRLRPVRMALYNVDSKTHEKIASIVGGSRLRGGPCHGTIGTMVNPALCVAKTA